jgi:hypothetical protein
MQAKPLVALTLTLFTVAAAAMTLNPKAIARFDHSYAKCEAKFPEMRGTRDEAYLSMYRIKVDAKSSAELAAVRRGAPYQAESRRARAEDAKKCRALWGETQRVRSLAK